MEESEVLFDQLAEEETPSEKPSEDQESMESLLEKEGLGFDFPKTGETRTGVIASVSPTEILVSVGAKSEGIVSGREYDQIDTEVRSAFQVGQEIPVYILSPEDKNGNLVLSYNRAREEIDWDTAERLQEADEAYESTVMGFNKGGLLVELGQLRGFVPASQIGLSRRLSLSGDTPEKRYSELIGEPLTIRVIEVDRSRRRLILSERMALKETRESLKEKLLDDLQVGDVRSGRVTSLADFGAFVNIDGADGLVHMSEISWERIQSPKDVLKVGQEVNVEVISIDRDRKRIGLSIRRLEDNPWLKKVEHIREGQLVESTITHLTKFGAFAKLGDEDLEGLIHVSELSQNRVEHPKEIVTEGDTMTLRVIKIDSERQRIGLSLRKVDSAAYADLDWKMLRDELDSALEDDALEVDETESSEDEESAEPILEGESAEVESEVTDIEEETVKVEPEETDEVEDTVEVEPEETDEVEDTIEVEPEETDEVEDTVEVEPEEMDEVEDTVEVEPEETDEVEDTVEIEPEETDAAEDTVEVEPEETDEVEDTVEVEPEETDEVEDTVEVEPEETDEVEDIIEVEPEGTDEVEDTVEIEPEGTDEVEDTVEVEPEETDEVEETIEVEPEETDEVEDTIEVEPEETDEVEDTVEIEPEGTDEVEDTVEVEPEEMDEVEDTVEVEPEETDEVEETIEVEPEETDEEEETPAEDDEDDEPADDPGEEASSEEEIQPDDGDPEEE